MRCVSRLLEPFASDGEIFNFRVKRLKGMCCPSSGRLLLRYICYLGKSLRERISAYVYSFLVFLFAGLVLAVTNVYTGESFTGLSAKGMGDFLAFGDCFLRFSVIMCLIGCLKYMKASSVSMTVLGEPLGGTILAYFLVR